MNSKAFKAGDQVRVVESQGPNPLKGMGLQ